MKRFIVILILLVFVASIGFKSMRARTNPWLHFFGKVLPESARLLNHEVVYMGFDVSYIFEFSVEDGALANDIIESWELTKDSGVSFVGLKPHIWWPSIEELNAMDVRYGRENDVDETYWSMWIDSSRNRIYVEFGRW